MPDMGATTLYLVSAIQIVEGVVEASEEEMLSAWQFLIDTGVCWMLQDQYAERAVELISNDMVDLPHLLDDDEIFH